MRGKYSCGHRFQAFGFDLREGPPVALQCGLVAGQVLPAGADYIAVCRVDFQAEAFPLRQFGGDERGPGAEEWIVNFVVFDGVVQDRTAHDLNRLLGRMSTAITVNRYG